MRTTAGSDLILAGAITPANRPEDEAAPELKRDIALQGRGLAELNIDRGYIASPLVDEVLGTGGQVICKPWRKLQKTPTGRAKLRERVAVEHRLAHLARRQGRRARYRGVAASAEPLRPAPRLRHPELRDDPAKGRVMRSLSNRSVF